MVLSLQKEITKSVLWILLRLYKTTYLPRAKLPECAQNAFFVGQSLCWGSISYIAFISFLFSIYHIVKHIGDGYFSIPSWLEVVLETNTDQPSNFYSFGLGNIFGLLEHFHNWLLSLELLQTLQSYSTPLYVASDCQSVKFHLSGQTLHNSHPTSQKN